PRPSPAPPEEKKNAKFKFAFAVWLSGECSRWGPGGGWWRHEKEAAGDRDMHAMHCKFAMQLGLAVGPVRVYPSHLAIRFRCAQQRRHADGSDALLEAGAAGSNKSPTAGRPA